MVIAVMANFKRRRNIFGDIPSRGVDPTDTANRPTVSRVFVDKDILRCMQNRNGLVVTFHKGGNHPVLYWQPTGFSLANNQPLALLLKALSARLADKYSVTTVIHGLK